jgi:hypothetical protein
MAVDNFEKIANKVIQYMDINRRRLINQEGCNGEALMLWDNFNGAEKKTLLETHNAYAYVNYYLMQKHGHFVDGVRLHAHGLEVYFDC